MTQLTGKFGITPESKEWGALGGLRGPAKVAFVKQLLAHGADPNDRVVKTPPLFGTSFSSHCTANCGRGIGLPLNHSLNNVLGVNLDGATPLLLAAEAGDAAVMRALLDAGADPGLTSKEKTTPLMLAAGLSWTAGQSLTTESSVLEAVKVAVESGNDVNAVSQVRRHGLARGRPGGDELGDSVSRGPRRARRREKWLGRDAAPHHRRRWPSIERRADRPEAVGGAASPTGSSGNKAIVQGL